MITVILKFFFFSNTEVHKFPFLLLMDFFFHCLTLLNPHCEDLFLIFRNTIDSIKGLLLLSSAPQGNIDTTVLNNLFLL